MTASQPEINQADLKALILTKDVSVFNPETGTDIVVQVPYNDMLRDLAWKLGAYKFDQKELRILREEIWAALPAWRRKQIEKPLDVRRVVTIKKI